MKATHDVKHTQALEKLRGDTFPIFIPDMFGSGEAPEIGKISKPPLIQESKPHQLYLGVNTQKSQLFPATLVKTTGKSMGVEPALEPLWILMVAEKANMSGRPQGP